MLKSTNSSKFSKDSNEFSKDSWNMMKHTLKYLDDLNRIENDNDEIVDLGNMITKTYAKILETSLPTTLETLQQKPRKENNKYFHHEFQDEYFSKDLETIKIKTSFMHYNLSINLIKEKGMQLSSEITKRIIAKCFTMMYLFKDQIGYCACYDNAVHPCVVYFDINKTSMGLTMGLNEFSSCSLNPSKLQLQCQQAY